jgi:hypothetical protein
MIENGYNLSLPYPWEFLPAGKPNVAAPPPPEDKVWWSGKQPPPARGDRVIVNFNGFGPGEVMGYFTEHGYLGIYVKVDKHPDWWLKQNKDGKPTLGNPNKYVMVFGVEIGPESSEPTKINIIDGKYDDEDWWGEVRVDGKVLDPGVSQKIFNHSPDGFAWGYGGSGPAQLALAILLAVGIPARVAVAQHHRFKAKFVQHLERASFVLEVDVVDWSRKTALADRVIA